MGQTFVDQYSTLHLLSGVLARACGLDFYSWFMAHLAFEVTENTDTGTIDFITILEIIHRALSIFDLLLANYPAKIAVAFTTTAHIETKGSIAPLVKHPTRTHNIIAAAVAAETV